jgi:putative membrane protein
MSNHFSEVGMFAYGTQFWGMHFLWWVFWFGAFLLFFSLLTPVPRRRAKLLQETPRETLLRRLSRGDIDEQEYERCKSIIERDAQKARFQDKDGARRGKSGQTIAT